MYIFKQQIGEALKKKKNSDKKYPKNSQSVQLEIPFPNRMKKVFYIYEQFLNLFFDGERIDKKNYK